MTIHNDDQKMEGHSYDGIDELDNSLPRWWLNSFYLTIVFAIIYSLYYLTGEGPTLVKEYERAKSDYEYAQYSHKTTVKTATEEELRAFLKEPARIKAGREIFQSKCVACHGPQGQGGIGPNLTDDYWIHGGKMTEILSVVTQGVLDKGMPPWGSMLKQDELHSVVTFVKSLRGSNPPGAKAPQGVLVKE
jgi:cytochrome c oxidase cbb3-type subunit 3